MKRIAFLSLLLLSCADPTAPRIGEESHCNQHVAAVRVYGVSGDPSAYALEIGICAYRIEGPKPSVPDSLVIVVSRSELEAAVNRVR